MSGAVLAPMAVLVSACSGAEVRDRVDSATDRLEAPHSTPPAPPNPDQPLVDGAVSAIAGLLDALEPVRTQDPAIPGLITLHRAHLARLGRARRPAAAVALDAGGAALMTQVASHENALAVTLAKGAASAQDGDLARLLAAMSAAVSQRVAVMAS
jgi:hypothetical protein